MMKRKAIVGLLICFALPATALVGGGRRREVEYNKALGQKVFAEIYGKGRVSLVGELYAEDFVDDSPGGGTGRELIKQAVTEFHRAMPDLHIEFEDVFATEDKVVIRYTARGTQTGPIWGILPSGKVVTVRGITIFLVSNGKIKTEWTEYDRLGVLRQLGVLP